MRILAAAGAAVICIAAGAAFSSALKARCRQLRQLSALTLSIASKIRYGAVPLPALMRELSETGAFSDCTFLRYVLAGMENGLTVQSAWIKAAHTVPFLSESDREITADIGARLGDTDTEGQLAMLSLAGEQLSYSLAEAERECTGRAAALMKVWMLCGLGAGVVLL